ncbi:protein TIPIN homolog [Toxorhynchites rutilus septentrionalis]|uniref:protein TIPIN homolog n=1 Tax=Toxorhynchites rutilus septentrionalis TaxID=329112 RepID=UPI00247A51CF|nr:protein TIPIN homolog [Toxorhynchites rutilus septentrionalis]XP_055640461.1 protein TIPIN homolog [Toxorhynchites rutilus septentrionalis]
MSHIDLFGEAEDYGNENDGEISHGGNDDNDQDAPEGDGKPVKVEPKKKVSRNPRFMLNVQRLCDSRGIVDLESYYKGIKFRGKGYEKEDLDVVMKKMQHWAHRMYPKYGLDDSLAAIEKLGRKKQMQSYMYKYRMGQLEPDVILDQEDMEGDGLAYDSNILNRSLDPLDTMLEEQIAISRGGNLNVSGVGNLTASESNFDSLRDNGGASSSVKTTPPQPTRAPSPELSEDMRAKIAANRLKALEIRRAKMAASASSAATPPGPVGESG